MLKPKNKKYYDLIAGSILVLLIVGAFVPSLNYLVDLGFSGLLLFATVMYTSLTKNILEDGRKNREIEFIQRQLECFYNPLLLTMEKAEIASKNVDIIDEAQNYHIACFDVMQPILEKGFHEIYNYHYLANKKIWGKVIDVMKAMVSFPNELLLETRSKAYFQTKDLEFELKEEVESLNEHLFNLINHKETEIG